MQRLKFFNAPFAFKLCAYFSSAAFNFYLKIFTKRKTTIPIFFFGLN